MLVTIASMLIGVSINIVILSSATSALQSMVSASVPRPQPEHGRRTILPTIVSVCIRLVTCLPQDSKTLVGRQQLESLHRYLLFKRIPTELSARIMGFFEYQQRSTVSMKVRPASVPAAHLACQPLGASAGADPAVGAAD